MAMQNPFKPGCQNYKMLERLRQGPATNTELSKEWLNYTGRISDIRARIKTQAMTIAKRNIGGGLVEYRLASTESYQLTLF